MNFESRFRVDPGAKVKLRKLDPDYHGKHAGPDEAADVVDKDCAKMRDLQYLMYAENRHSLLIVLQAPDTAGKDGTINHVLNSMSPQGTYAHGFKPPTPEEASHDFLWRAHTVAPARGQIAIFNRSHYEDVLVTRVHKLVPKEVWSSRYDLINAFEQGLVDNGCTILKFFLHISPEEQLKRFKERLDDPTKQWKISEADYAERDYWADYIKAYEAIFKKTSTKHAPWYIIPANHKWFRNMAVARIVVDAMESLKMKFPKPTVDVASIRRKYHSQKHKEDRRR
jgi:PPK2 family polyphosphate:nucleotide phosphotransferase